MPVRLDDFLQEIENSIAASEKRAMDEEDTVGGETSHPSKGHEDGTQPHKDGERAREHDQFVRKQEGEVSVNSTPDATTDHYSNDRAYEQIGSTATVSGHDPANETDGTAGVQKDEQIGGDTTHPANTENPELGGKYASDKLAKLSAAEISGVLTKLGEDLCRLVIQNSSPAQPQPTPQNTKQAQEQQREAAQAAQAGWEMAGWVDSLDKTAADSLARGMLEQTIREAASHADMTAQYLMAKAAESQQAYEQSQEAWQQAQHKQASDQAAATHQQRVNHWTQWLMSKEAMEEMMAQNVAPAEDTGAELVDAMSGESADDAPADAGPPADDAGQIEALAELLAQLNISPEELEALLQAQEAGLPAESMPAEAGSKEAADRQATQAKMASRTKASQQKITEIIKELASRSRQR